MKTHWYLVANRAGARLFSQAGTENALKLVRRLDNPDGRLKDSELVSDRQGRQERGSAAGFAPVGADDAPRTEVLAKFCREVAAFLESEANAGNFSSIALIAEPQCLGELRKQLGARSKALVTEELAKDLASVGDHEMVSALSDVLCRRESVEPRA